MEFKDLDESETNKTDRAPKGKKNSETLCHVAPINYNVESCGAKRGEKRATLIRYSGSHVA